MKTKRILLILMVVICGCLFSGCDSQKDDKYYIPNYMIEAQEMSGEQFVELMISQGRFDGKYEKLYTDKNGNVIFECNEKQREEMLLYSQDEFATACINLVEYGYQVNYDNSYMELKLSCDKEVFDQEYTLYLAYYASMCQSFNNVVLKDNYLEISVVDIDTQELLYEETFSAGKGKPEAKDIVHPKDDNPIICVIPKSVVDASKNEDVYAISSMVPNLSFYSHRYQKAYFDDYGNYVMELSGDQKQYWLTQSTQVLQVFNDINTMFGLYSFATRMEYDASTYEYGVVYCNQEEFGDIVTELDVMGIALTLSNCQSFMGESTEQNNVVVELTDGNEVFYQVTIENGVLVE